MPVDVLAFLGNVDMLPRRCVGTRADVVSAEASARAGGAAVSGPHCRGISLRQSGPDDALACLIESEDATKHLRDWLTLRSALLAVVLIGGATAFAANMEDAFLEENDTAMTKMTVDMLAEPTGDVDADFVATMIAHHQGAIDMARAQLRYGTSAQVRHVAQAIIAREEKEIVALRRAADAARPALGSAQ